MSVWNEIRSNFWREYRDLPAGVGYPLFGPKHLTVLATLFLIGWGITVMYRRQSERGRRRLTHFLAILLPCMEGFKQVLLVLQGHWGPGYLPLHLCSFGIPVFLLAEFLPWAWWRETFGEIGFVLILPGGVAGLLFADWPPRYPLINFFSLHSYIWHSILVLFPVLLLLDHRIRPSLTHLWRGMAFLLVIGLPVLYFDRVSGYNYLFLMRFVPGSPLEAIARLTHSTGGTPAYIAGFALLALCVMALICLPFTVADRVRGRRRGEEQSD